jgi:hypothetical protein
MLQTVFEQDCELVICLVIVHLFSFPSHGSAHLKGHLRHAYFHISR